MRNQLFFQVDQAIINKLPQKIVDQWSTRKKFGVEESRLQEKYDSVHFYNHWANLCTGSFTDPFFGLS